MENRLIELFLSFREKGYMAIEIPWLIKDAIHLTADIRLPTLIGSWKIWAGELKL